MTAAALNASLGIREISQRITITSASWDWQTAQMRFITATLVRALVNEVTDDAHETKEEWPCDQGNGTKSF